MSILKLGQKLWCW